MTHTKVQNKKNESLLLTDKWYINDWGDSLLLIQEAKVMKQETSVVARNYRLQEWAVRVGECNNRPRGMTITQWGSKHDIKSANYYYRLNEVRKACLETLPVEDVQQQVVPVSQKLLGQKAAAPNISGLEVSVNGISIHVTEATGTSESKRFITRCLPKKTGPVTRS